MNKCNSIYFFPTFQCNLKCIHCWASASNEVNIKLSGDDMISIIKEADKFGLKNIKFTGGEPLLVKNEIIKVFDYLLSCLPEKQYYITIETNGLLLNELIVEYLYKLNCEVCISIHSINAQEHDDFVNCNGAYNELIKKIELLSNIKRKQFMTSVTTQNMDQLEKNVDFGLKNGIDTFKFNILVPVGRAEELNLFLNSENIYKVLKIVKNIKEKNPEVNLVSSLPFCLERFDIKTKVENIVTTRSCDFLHTINILPNGDASLCAWSKLTKDSELFLGNVLNDTFENVWKISNSINEKLDNLKGVCEKCIMKKTCKGSCRAMAYYKYNSIDAPLPLCQMLYEDNLFPKNKLINV